MPLLLFRTTPSGFTVYKVPQTCKGDDACYRKYLEITGCGDPEERFTPSKEKEDAPKSGYRVTWCTRNTGMFNSYLSNGPYYLFKNWNTRRQFQLHYESGQLKDESDQENLNLTTVLFKKEFLQFLGPNAVPPPTINSAPPNNGQTNENTIGAISNSSVTESGETGNISYKTFMDTLVTDTQTYFTTVVNKNREVANQYNNAMRQQWMLERNYMNGKNIHQQLKVNTILYGKPNNIQQRVR